MAASGSGKTMVGLEIIRRLDHPCPILMPSITIRGQWVERFCSGFLPEGEDPLNWVSRSMKTLKPVTAVTYQALCSAYKQLTGNFDNDELSEVSAAYVCLITCKK
ncbi:DEAD/DEAH box helicase family protein [Sporolactobacillus shoreicorticis]|uniref:DEAD/DEAH box helicase family protein n=1 Tax=Sporolactobacillus shoreicorticis TaxID=1923877 RepID=A0ABW5S2V8_9BACL